jgi:hypothetical protein
MRRVAVLALAVLGFAPAVQAEGVSVRDVIELSRAGLSEEVLLAVIEVNRGVYAIDPGTLKTLKAAGVPDRVIVAMVRSGREPLPEPLPPAVETEEEDAAASAPPVVVIEHQEPARTEIREVMVPVPVYVPVPAQRSPYRRTDRRAPAGSSTYVPFQPGLPAERPVLEQPREPVYWGFGGKLRPDAWKPEGHSRESGERHRK